MSKFAAIVLSAGVGNRMKSNVPKQYMDLLGKPVIYYSLKAFEENGFSEIILVCGADDVEYCRKEIIEKHNLSGVTAVVPGGKERYQSVYAGLNAIQDADYVFIHDGARPLIDQQTITNLKKAVIKEEAAVAGMPVKDTIKIVDEEAYVSDTPQREYVWQVQTPQCFLFSIIKEAYQSIIQDEEEGWTIPKITDDAMVLEYATDHEVKMIEASYHNIKITTPEDLDIAQILMSKRQ